MRITISCIVCMMLAAISARLLFGGGEVSSAVAGVVYLALKMDELHRTPAEAGEEG